MCFFQQFLRQSRVGRGHDLVQQTASSETALDGVAASGRRAGRKQDRQDEQRNHHVTIPSFTGSVRDGWAFVNRANTLFGSRG